MGTQLCRERCRLSEKGRAHTNMSSKLRVLFSSEKGYPRQLDEDYGRDFKVCPGPRKVRIDRRRLEGSVMMEE